MFIYLFELNFLRSDFKICLGAAQKYSEGRMRPPGHGLKTPALDSVVCFQLLLCLAIITRTVLIAASSLR
jgi:hypothetical protein